MAASEVYRELGEAAWAWVVGHVREEDGPWLPEVVPDDGRPVAPADDRDSLYAGIGGLAPVLAEIGQYRAVSAAEQVLATGIVARLSAMAHTRAEPSLYSGLGGNVTALRAVARLAARCQRVGGLGWACSVHGILPMTLAAISVRSAGSQAMTVSA